MTDSTTAQALRTKVLARAYQRHLHCKPSTLEKHALLRAASLTARAELAAADPTVSVDEVVRADNAASRARAELAKAIAARHAANGNGARSPRRPAHHHLLPEAISEPTATADIAEAIP
jgi:hypothetical protein